MATTRPYPRPPALTEREQIVRQDKAFASALRAAFAAGLERQPIPSPYEGEWKPRRYQVLTETYSLTSSSAGWLDGGER